MVDIADAELIAEFDEFGVDLSDSDVIDKLKQLCQMYHLEAADMAAEWLAFSHSNKHHKICTLNQEFLDMMERERLSKRAVKPNKPRASKMPTPHIYDVDTLQQAADAGADEEIIGTYSTPGKGNKKRQVTPDINSAKRLMTSGRSPAVPFSPASFSPSIATPSKKYASRSSAGEVVCTHGKTKNVQWKTRRNHPCSVLPYDRTCTITKAFKYMFQKLTDKAHVLNDLIEDIATILKKENNIDEFSHVALPAQESVSVVGRICCDSNGKLNAKSVVLEGSRETSAGRQIPVDLSDVPSYSLFPGQIVAMDGVNTSGNKFVAKNIYANKPLPIPEKKPELKDGALTIVVAAGPFTTSDSIMYEPLADLVKYLQKESPDICILMGPFLDARNPELEKTVTDVTFDEFFQSTVQKVALATERSNTQLVLVPSQRDLHHDAVYPQPPYHLKTTAKDLSDEKSDNKDSRVLVASDPCVLNIDGVVIGLSSTDILFHLGAEEISCPAGGSDRLARLTQHLLTQQSFYPLYPAHEEVNLDYEQFEQTGRLPVTPHLMLLPSDLRYFIKDVCGCCCLNPGRLAKGQVGGTYARLSISPSASSPATSGSIMNQITAQVLKI